MLVIRDARAGGRTTILNHRVLNDREIRWIDALIAALTQQNLFSTQLVISADSIYTLTTRDGWSLIADLSADPAVASTHIRALLASLSTPVRSRLEYIDLRFNDRGFYKIR